MPASLKNSPTTNHALGYIVYEYPKQQPTLYSQATAFDFLDYMKAYSPLALATMPIQASHAKQSFRVFYKEKDQWLQVNNTFTTLIAAIPYLQSGIRVLIEFRNPKL